MAEYIDREELIENLNKLSPEYYNALINQLITKQPIADVLEVVRCKDCKHATFYNCKNDACYKGIICEYEIGTDDENFYCIYGEARTPKEKGGEK